MYESLLLYGHESAYDRVDITPLLTDLRIDAVIDAVLAVSGERDYLREYYSQKPCRPDDVRYRLEIMRDLGNHALCDGMNLFVQQYNLYKRYIAFAAAATKPDIRAKYHLDAAVAYNESLFCLERALSEAECASRAFKRFHGILLNYLRSDKFALLKQDADACMEAIGDYKYSLDVRPSAQVVLMEEDKSAEDYFSCLEGTFARYRCDAFNSSIAAFADIHMCLLETMILERIRKAQPAMFASVRAFYEKHINFGEAAFELFERELHFYLSFITYRSNLEEKGLYFSLPQITEERTVLSGGYDLALAQNNTRAEVVTNDFFMSQEETHFILTGPNQGGKTTYARMLGQCLYLAHMGLPAPCRRLEFRFFSGLYTHFIVPEVSGGKLGRLKEELTRLKQLLDFGASNGFVIVNELFSSAASSDAREMGNLVLDRLGRAGCVCLYVTHIFELAHDGPGRVSLVAGIDGKRRTFRIERRPADGKAFANQLMDKHRLYRQDIGVRLNDRFNSASV